MHKHLEKLDSLCEQHGLGSVSSFCDSTDMQCNLELLDLPESMSSTDELMALQGVWIEADTAAKILDALIQHIRSENIKFGLLKNDHDQVLAELQESYAFAMASARSGAKFNFSIVM